MLVGLSALVLVSDVIGGIAPGIGVMLAARAVLGVCVGGFWVFGAGAAITLVSERARGTAVAVVSSGIFIATVASLPAGSLIGTLTTWGPRSRSRPSSRRSRWPPSSPRCRGWAPAARFGRGRC